LHATGDRHRSWRLEHRGLELGCFQHLSELDRRELRGIQHGRDLERWDLEHYGDDNDDR